MNKRIDMKYQKCDCDKSGYYDETGFYDDLDGVLHCVVCGKTVDRYYEDTRA